MHQPGLQIKRNVFNKFSLEKYTSNNTQPKVSSRDVSRVEGKRDWKKRWELVEETADTSGYSYDYITYLFLNIFEGIKFLLLIC